MKNKNDNKYINDYIDFTNNDFFLNIDLYNQCEIPFGLNITPFINKNFSISNKSLIKCKKCHSIKSIYNKTNLSNEWYCLYCHNLNNNEKEDNNFENNIFYDYNINNNINEFYYNYVIILSNLDNKKYIIDCIRNYFENNSIKNKRFFIIFYDNEQVFFFKKNKKNICILNININEIFIPDYYKNLLYNENEINLIFIILDYIENYNNNNLDKKNLNNFNNIFNIIEISFILLKNEKYGKIILFNENLNFINNIYNKNSYNKNNNKIKLENNENENINIYIEKLGKNLNENNITIDIYQINFIKKYNLNNLNFLSKLSQMTNGKFYIFKSNNISNLYYSFINSFHIEHAISIKIKIFYSSFLTIKFLNPFININSNNEIHLSNLNCNDSLSFKFKFKNKIKEEIEHFNFQFIINYFNIQNGEFFKRIFNLKLQSTQNIFDYYKFINLEGLLSIIVKNIIYNIFNKKKYIFIKEIFEDSFIKNFLNLKYISKEILEKYLIIFLSIIKHKYFYLLNKSKILKLHKLSIYINKSPNILSNIFIPKIYDISNYIFENNNDIENIFNNKNIIIHYNQIKKEKIYIIYNNITINFYFSINNNKILQIFFGENMTKNIIGSYTHTIDTVIYYNKNKEHIYIKKLENLINYIRKNILFNINIKFSFEGSKSENILKNSFILDNFFEKYPYSIQEYYKYKLNDNI